MRVRPSRPAELAAVAALVNAAYRGDTARRGWTHEADLLGGQRTDPATLGAQLAARPGAVLLVGEATDRSGALRASVLLEPEADGAWHLGMLTVHPDEQGRGLGRALLRHAEAAAARGGARAVRMTVIAIRTELVAWYERRGYRPVGRAPFPHDDERFGRALRGDLDFLVMEKPLRTRETGTSAPADPS